MKLNKVLESITEKLSQKIPDPARKPEKPSSSWRKLKKGQLLYLQANKHIYNLDLNALRGGGLSSL